MWFEEVQKQLVSDEVRRTQVVNLPFQNGDEVVTKVPDDLVPILQLAALYRQQIGRLDEQARAVFRKDHELRLRMQSLTYQTMIDALASIFHCSLLAQFAETGMSGSMYQLVLSGGYEIRDGWLVVIPKTNQRLRQ